MFVLFGTILSFFHLNCANAGEERFPGNENSFKEKEITREKAQNMISEILNYAADHRMTRIEKGALLTRLAEKKKKADCRDYAPDSMVNRRDLRNIYGELHQIIQEERRTKNEIRQRISILSQNTELSMELVTDRLKDLENKKLEGGERSDERLKRIEQDLLTLRIIKRVLEFIEKNPLVTDYFGFDMDDSEVFFEPPFDDKKPEECPMEKRMDFEKPVHHMGFRVLQRVRRLDKEIEFMKRRLNNAERELERFQEIYERLEETHPDVLERIEKELESGDHIEE